MKHEKTQHEDRVTVRTNVWSKLMTVGTWAYSIIVLSFLWCVAMALVIPAGPACAALCEASKRLLTDDDTSLMKRFVIDLWRYRWRGTAVFWTGVAIYAFILLDLRIARVMTTPFGPILQILLWWLLLMCSMFVCNAFPLLIQHTGRLRAFYKQLGVFTMATLPRSVLALLVSAVLVIAGLSSAFFAILFCGGLLGLWNTWNTTNALYRLQKKAATIQRK